VVTIQYRFEYPYALDRMGRSHPRLALRLANPGDLTRAVDVDGYLDSGAERSLFGGELAAVLGIELLAGEPQRYESTTGAACAAHLHEVRLLHEDLGVFDLRVGFSTQPIKRNLLGRDFFDRVQIGFREHYSTFYVLPQP
jgi:hypothetical protein